MPSSDVFIDETDLNSFKGQRINQTDTQTKADNQNTGSENTNENVPNITWAGDIAFVILIFFIFFIYDVLIAPLITW